MSAGTGGQPLRVEQALRLLPDVDALAPLRAFLVSTSRVRPPAEPYGTVGKRYVQPADFRQRLPRALARVTDHLRVLYDESVAALECEQRGDLRGAVAALLRAGGHEERVGRRNEAYVWFEHALRIAQELRDRRPEIEALRHLGSLLTARGQLEEGARMHQRSLALAEAEFDPEGAALACDGLAEVAAAQAKWQGAESWYQRGLQHAAGNHRLTARLCLGLGGVARHREQVAAAADWLTRARQLFEEQLRDAEGTARTLQAWGALEALRGRYPEALAYYREALARLHDGSANRRLDLAVRLNICQLFLDWGRLPDAEDEIRRAEETAIMRNFTRELAVLYLVMGKVRGRQDDERGFVFFEKAIELCRGRDPLPRLEAEVYLEYALFRKALGDRDEVRAYLERSREILETLGDRPLLARVDAELAQLAPV